MKTLLAVLLLITCSAATVLADVISIGVSLGLQGRHAEISRLQEKSFRLWERDVNRRGGILGRKVRLIVYDNKSQPEIASQQYRKLITEQHVDLLFAPYSSELTEAVLPLTEMYGYPLIASGASGDRLWNGTQRYFFGLYTMASRYTAGFLEMLAKNNIKHLAILYADDAFSIGIANGSKQMAENMGIKVSVFSGFNKNSKEFDTFIKKARGARSDAVMLCAYLDEAVEMSKALKQNGWQPKAYYASVGPALKVYQEKLGKNAELSFSSSHWERFNKFNGSEAFYRSFIKAYGAEPSYHAANAYAAGEIMERAIRKAGSLNRDKIRDYLSKSSMTTIIGRYGVDKSGRQIKHFPLIIQIQRGKKEIVWPQGIATAKPVFK